MALFGFLVSAPLGHAMVKTMHRFFAGRTGTGAKLGMLATSMLVIAPIQIAVFLTNSAVVEGARTKEAVLKVLKKGFAPVLGVTWITSPTAIMFAQTFLPPEVRAVPRTHHTINASPSRFLPLISLFHVVWSSVFQSCPVLHRGKPILQPTIGSPSIPLTPSQIPALFQYRCDQSCAGRSEEEGNKEGLEPSPNSHHSEIPISFNYSFTRSRGIEALPFSCSLTYSSAPMYLLTLLSPETMVQELTLPQLRQNYLQSAPS